jgi:integrase
MSTATLSNAARAIVERVRLQAERRPHNVLVRDLIDRRMANYNGRDTSQVQRLSIWRDLLGEFTLEAVTLDVMREARAEIAKLPALAFKGRDHEGARIFRVKGRAGVKNKTPATINRYSAAISGVFTWAIAEGLTPVGWTNPCRGLKRLPGERERVRFLDTEERARLFAACKASRYVRLYALVLMAILTGARRGELMALTWRDVDLDRGTARIGRSKNGDRRTLVLLPQVVAALRPFAGEASRYVFGSARTRQQAPASIDTAWREATARAKLHDFRFHDLRHCTASYLAQAGKPLNVIADVLGHRKLDMTRRYAHLIVETKAQAMNDALGDIQ